MTKIFIIGTRQQIELALREVQEYEPGTITYHMYHHFGAHDDIAFILYVEDNLAHYYSEVDTDNEEIDYIKQRILEEYPNAVIYNMLVQEDELSASMNAMQLGGKKKKRRRKNSRSLKKLKHKKTRRKNKSHKRKTIKRKIKK